MCCSVWPGQISKCSCAHLDSATLIVEIIWPLSVPSCHEDSNVGRGVLPLRTFIQETLRRSRTSYSTLQVALYYLILIKPHVPGHDFTMEQQNDVQSFRALQCGRRMFLAALILASKYLQDRNYSAQAWSKISGLRVGEINSNELTFCQAVDWNFHIPEQTFDRWSDIVLKHTPSSQPPPPSDGISSKMSDWKVTIPLLTPGLGSVTVNPSNKEYARSEVCGEAHKWVALDVPGDSRSLDTTPTPAKPPQYLEPKFEMAPPPPSLARLGLLPTPQLTPKSLMGPNPLNARRPSLAHGASKPAACPPMTKGQSMGMNRSSVEGWMQVSRPTPSEGPQYLRNKVPLAPPSIASSGSSPESMISDQLSRSSRASSISSVSSSTWGYQPNLARLATCRSANIPMTIHAENEPAKLTEGLSIFSGNNIYAEDAVTALEHLAFSDGPSAVNTPSPIVSRNSPVAVTAVKGGSHSSPDAGPRRSSARPRKRGRSSNDMSNLHQDVRAILHATSPSLRLASSQLPAECKTPTCVEMVQGPDVVRNPSATRRLPVQKDLGRKRACCAGEIYRESPVTATAVLKATWQDPGVWGGVL